MQKFIKQRRIRLRKLLRQSGLDAFLVTNTTNVRYLTGFTGSSGYLLMTGKEEFLLSDTRYSEQIQTECPDVEAIIRTAKSTMLASVASTIKSAKLKSVGFQKTSITKALFDDLESTVETEWVGVDDWVQQLRSIKDKHELELIRRSIGVNERAFNVIKAQLTPEQTELQIAHNLEHQMRQFGATSCSFSPIVGVGSNGALPHATPGSRTVSESSFVLIDWGAEVEGYASDLTRIVVTSKKIPAKLRKVYEVVLKAQMSAIKKIKPGVSLKTVDSAARSVIDSAGYGKYFGHGLGHGFGLEIHEIPFMSPIHEGILEANMVITVEPGIYLPGWGGVRIEDDVLVTSSGFEVLSHLPKQIEDCVVDLN